MVFYQITHINLYIFGDILDLFYMNLQSELLLPARTIKTIIQGFQDIYGMSQLYLLYKLSEKLTTLEFSLR